MTAGAIMLLSWVWHCGLPKDTGRAFLFSPNLISSCSATFFTSLHEVPLLSALPLLFLFCLSECLSLSICTVFLSLSYNHPLQFHHLFSCLHLLSSPLILFLPHHPPSPLSRCLTFHTFRHISPLDSPPPHSSEKSHQAAALSTKKASPPGLWLWRTSKI